MPRITTTLVLSALFLLASCGRDAADPNAAGPSDGGPEGVQEGDPDLRLIKTGLGKEDFALIEAELRCVDKAFTGEAAEKARATVIAKWMTTDEWVQGVRAHVQAETEFAAKIDGALKKHSEKVCPGGVPTDAFIKELDMPAPSADAAPASEAPVPAAEAPAPE